MVGGRVGFLVGGLLERARGSTLRFLKKCFFDQVFF